MGSKTRNGYFFNIWGHWSPKTLSKAWDMGQTLQIMLFSLDMDRIVNVCNITDIGKRHKNRFFALACPNQYSRSWHFQIMSCGHIGWIRNKKNTNIWYIGDKMHLEHFVTNTSCNPNINYIFLYLRM